MLKATKFQIFRLALYVILWFGGVHGLPSLLQCWLVIRNGPVSAFFYSLLYCLTLYGPIVIPLSLLRPRFRSGGHSIIYFPNSDVMTTAYQNNRWLLFIIGSSISNAGWAFMSHMRFTIIVVTRHLRRRKLPDIFHSPRYLDISWEWLSTGSASFFCLETQSCKLCTMAHKVGNRW